MKKILLTLFLLLFPFTASATTQIFMGSQTVYRAAGSRIPLYGRILNAGATTAVINGVLPTAGTFSSLYAYTNVDPGAGSGWTVTVEDNGSGQSITCPITSPATSCNDLINTFTASAGDIIDVVFNVSGTPASTAMYFSMKFSPTVSNQTVWLNTTANLTLGSTIEAYFPLGASKTPTGSETTMTSIVPEGGTFSNMFESGSTVSPGTYTFTVKNFSAGATTTVTCVDSSTGCSDTTHTYATSSPAAGVIGDRVDVANMPNSSPTSRSRGGGIVFSPTATGDFVYPISFGNDSASTQRFNPFGSQTGGNDTTEATSTLYAQTMVITDMQVYIDTTSTAGKNRTFTIRQNNATTTATCTISGGASSPANNNCRWTGTLNVALGDTVDVVDIPLSSNNPSATTGNISIIANVPSPTVVNPPKLLLWGQMILRGFMSI